MSLGVARDAMSRRISTLWEMNAGHACTTPTVGLRYGYAVIDNKLTSVPGPRAGVLWSIYERIDAATVHVAALAGCRVTHAYYPGSCSLRNNAYRMCGKSPLTELDCPERFVV